MFKVCELVLNGNLFLSVILSSTFDCFKISFLVAEKETLPVSTRIKVLSGDSRTYLVASLLPGLLLSTHRGQLARLEYWFLLACKIRCTNPKPRINSSMGEGRYFTVIHLKLLDFASYLREDVSM
jgi:hypothetical protein